MRGRKQKSYKAYFFVVTSGGERDHTAVQELLAGATGGFTKALALTDEEDEKYQIRSIVALGKGKTFKGVFGRVRFGEKPIQATERGEETDVELKPGHGLVEKNFFLFYANRNLLVYQANPSGSHYSRFQRYANLAIGQNILFEPILTTDAYERLIRGSDPREIDLSFQQPKDPSLYENVWTQDMMKLLNKAGAVNARIRISVGRTNRHLVGQMKDVAVLLAKAGLARVARVKLEEEQEPIDLITDRIIESVTVRLNQKGRPEPEDVYAALSTAVDRRARDLKSFYGS